ncbi:MAG: PilZ domain-containing protein [Deltaproteobacteria bacterium]|nr:PilZ domain-containing protein [Deltaproteobacteria bacterium]
MQSPRKSLFAGRGFARRAVALPCELYTPRHDTPLVTLATNLSESGMYVETLEPLACGEDVVVSFWPHGEWAGGPLTLFAQIARPVPGRRQGDRGSGVGLRFLDLSRAERCALTRWLRRRPRLTPGIRRSSSWLPLAAGIRG